MDKFKFTVFTPTYNRGNTLHRVYKSLVNQSFRDFEWLIIDDGSSDNTGEVVNEFIRTANFSIRYLFQDNKHKFHTILEAVKIAKGDFFYIIDSDDEIFPNALELLYKYWVSIPINDRHFFSGVTGLCVDQHMKLIGTKFPSDIFDSDTLESSVKYGIKGEKSGFQRTDLMREFSFNEGFFNNGYIPEGLFWVGLANKGYKTRYFNEYIRKYYVDAGESIMTTAKFVPNAYGTHQYTLLFINSYKGYYLRNLRQIIGQIRNFTVSGWILGYSSLSLLNKAKYLIIKILFIITLPISFFYFYYVKKE
ncbi:MAG TPA: glycosyltransferase family 2 protein [Saprospiraceae bacterium]|nr:glycosyltransferase family 2 protein [Saprospiraceae bacterium]HRG19650.1 glycosyltransferase family 2 protein [Saprospiraceae bacterium]